MSARSLARSELRRRPKQHLPSLIVTIIGAAFGAVLLSVSTMLNQYVETTMYNGSAGLSAVLSTLALLFLGIAVFVAGIVTTNTFSTIIAGRSHEIALTRVIGATAKDLRRAVALEGLVVGVVGAVVGVLLGWLAAAAIALIAQSGFSLNIDVPTLLQPMLLVPLIAGALTTWLAAWAGGARVLTVSPMQAIGNAEEVSFDAVAARPVRTVLALLAIAIGGAMLVAGVFLGQSSGYGLFVAFFGGVISFVGVVGIATRIMPPVLRLIGALLGRGAAARLGAANAMRHPERSARSTIGVVIGITLITTFVVAAQTVKVVLYSYSEASPDPSFVEESKQIVDNVMVIASVLIGFAVLIALVGLVNTLTLNVLQRTREIGLLRAVGFTRSQVKRMILAESAQSAIAATVVGVALGIFYGWAGALSLLGQQSPGIVPPAIPVSFVVIIVVGAAVVSMLASVAPSRKATSVAPVTALAVE